MAHVQWSGQAGKRQRRSAAVSTAAVVALKQKRLAFCLLRTIPLLGGPAGFEKSLAWQVMAHNSSAS